VLLILLLMTHEAGALGRATDGMTQNSYKQIAEGKYLMELHGSARKARELLVVGSVDILIEQWRDRRRAHARSSSAASGHPTTATNRRIATDVSCVEVSCTPCLGVSG